MNYIEINKLKNVFSDFQQRQITLKSIQYGVEGKIIAIGYGPYWTNRHDSKIEKLELDILSAEGIVVPLVLKNIIAYNMLPKENRRNKKYKPEKLELVILSPDMNRYLSQKKTAEVSETVVFDIVYDG